MSDQLNDLFNGIEEDNGEDMTSPGTSETPTQPYRLDNEERQLPPPPLKPYRIGIGNSTGIRRDHNEDALFSISSNLISNDACVPMGLYIVADGMGGHVQGEKASEFAIQAMVKTVVPELISTAVGLSPSLGENKMEEIMTEGVHSAHHAVQKNVPGGGSTLTGMLILGDRITIAHIGDSRAYHFESESDPHVLTTDHSLVKRLEDLGQITADEAAIHPQRNILYRALGQVEQTDAEIISLQTPASGYLVLCSDGLWGAVSDKEMQKIIFRDSDPQEASQTLLEAANQAGGPDNISVIIIKIPEQPESAD